MLFHTTSNLKPSRPGSFPFWANIAVPTAFSLCQWLLDRARGPPTVPPTRTSPLIQPTPAKVVPLPTPTVTQTPAQDLSSPVAPLLWGVFALTVLASIGATLAAYRIMETDTPPPKPWPAPPRRPNLHPLPNANKKRKPQARKRRDRPPPNDPPPPPPDPPSPDAAVVDPSPRPRLPWWLMVLIYIASTISAVYVALELVRYFFPERCEALWDNLLQKWGIVEDYAHYQAQQWESAFDEAMTPKTTLRPPPSWGHNTALPPRVSVEVSVPKESPLPLPGHPPPEAPQPTYTPALSPTDCPDDSTVVIPPPAKPLIPAPVLPSAKHRFTPRPRPVEPPNPFVTSLLAAGVTQEFKDISGLTSIFHIPLIWVQSACVAAAGVVAIATFVEQHRRLLVRRSNPETVSLQFTEDEGEEEEVEEEAPDFTRSCVSQVGSSKETHAAGPNGDSALSLQGEKPLPDTENLLEEPEESSTLPAAGATTTLYQETEPTLFRHSANADSCLLPPTPTPLPIGPPKGSSTLPRATAPPLGQVQRLLESLLLGQEGNDNTEDAQLPSKPVRSILRSSPIQWREGRARTKSAASKTRRPYISPLRWPSTSDAEEEKEVEESILRLDILAKPPMLLESQAPLEDVNKPKYQASLVVKEKDDTRKGRARTRSAASRTRRRIPYISPLRWSSTPNAGEDTRVPPASDPAQTLLRSLPPAPPPPLPPTGGETEAAPSSDPVQTLLKFLPPSPLWRSRSNPQTESNIVQARRHRIRPLSPPRWPPAGEDEEKDGVVPDSPGLIAFFEELGLMGSAPPHSFASTSTPQAERQGTKKASRPPPPVAKKKEDDVPTSDARWREKNPAPPEPIRVFRGVSMRPPPVLKDDDPRTSGPSGSALRDPTKEFLSRRTGFEKDAPPRPRPVKERTKKGDEHPSGSTRLPEGSSLASRAESRDDNRDTPPRAAAKSMDTIPPRQEVDVERRPADAGANAGGYFRMSEEAFRSNILAFKNMRPEDRPASSWNLFQPREGGVRPKRCDEDDGDSMVANRSTNPPKFGDEIVEIDGMRQVEDEVVVPTPVSTQPLQDMVDGGEGLVNERQKKPIRYHPSGLAALAAVDRLLADIQVRAKQAKEDMVRRAASLASYKEVLAEIDELAVVVEDMKKSEAAARVHLPPPLPMPVVPVKPSSAPVTAQRRERRAPVVESTSLVEPSTASLPPAPTPLPTLVDAPPAPLVIPNPQENLPALESASLPELTIPQPPKFTISPPSPITALQREDRASVDSAPPAVPPLAQFNTTCSRRKFKPGPDIRSMRGMKRGRDPNETIYRSGSPEAILALSSSRPDVTLVPPRSPSPRLSPSDRVPNPGMPTINRSSATGTSFSKKKPYRPDFDFIDEFQETLESQLRGVLARLDNMIARRDRPHDETRTVVEERVIESETVSKKGKEKERPKMEVTVKVEFGGSSDRGTGQEVITTTRIQNAEVSSSKAYYS